MDKLSSQFPEFRKKYLRIVDSEELREPHPPVPEYTCTQCHDAGYLRADVPFGHPNFGKPVKCACTVKRERDTKQVALENLSGIVHYSRYEDADFDHFNKRAPGTRIAYNAAFAYADDPDGWLVFRGPCGCGKTHLAVSIAKKCVEQGKLTYVQTVPDLLDNLRTSFDPKAEVLSYNTLFDDMKNAEVLVLDDYGAENTTSWAIEKLFQILNYRYNAKLPTVITTNDELDRIDFRIRSRLNDRSLVEIVNMDECEDFRTHLEKKHGQ